MAAGFARATRPPRKKYVIMKKRYVPPTITIEPIELEELMIGSGMKFTDDREDGYNIFDGSRNDDGSEKNAGDVAMARPAGPAFTGDFQFEMPEFEYN